MTGGSLVAKKGNISVYGGEASNQTMLSVAYGPVSLYLRFLKVYVRKKKFLH